MAKIEKIPYDKLIADKIIKALEDGTAPWVKPWSASDINKISPINIVTNKQYNGINYINLFMTAMERGYDDPRWMTFNQAKSIGAKVKKGEKATLVKFFKFTETREVLDEDGKPILNEKGEPLIEEKKLENPKLIWHYVFNANQCENVPELEQIEDLDREFKSIEVAEEILKNSGADIRHIEGDRAYYSPNKDFIVLPKKEQFLEVGEMAYYSTALHELGHWTGHESRLNRDLSGTFGTPSYAKEELRAEIASFMLSSKLGIDFDPQQHYAYIDSWIKILEDDSKEILRASSDALKITNYITDLQKERAIKQDKEVQIDRINKEALFDKKTYLIVKYNEKELAKAAGAKWDNKAKSWYAPIGASKDKLKQWTFEYNESQSTNIDPVVEFKEVLERQGFIIDGLPILDGKIHRIDTADKKKGNKNGWYLGFSDGRPNAIYGDFAKGQDSAKNALKWKSMSSELESGYSKQEAKEFKEEYKAKQLKAQEELFKEQLKSAKILEDEFNSAKKSDNSHSYLVAKGVKNYNLKIDKKGNLLIPLKDIDGKLWSLQRIGMIDKDKKSFKMIGVLRTKDERDKDIRYPSKIEGTFFIIGQDKLKESNKIIIVEGYATGATVYEATNLPTIVAISSNNMEKVAKEITNKYPNKKLIIAGDNDISNELKGKENIGKLKAQATSLAVKGELALPRFTKKEIEQGASDWNDLHKSRGLDEVKKQLKIAIEKIKTKEQTKKLQKEQEQNRTKKRFRQREVVRKQALRIK